MSVVDANRITAIIRENVRFDESSDYKMWDSLPMDVRWILREAAKCIEVQSYMIEELRRKLKEVTNNEISQS